MKRLALRFLRSLQKPLVSSVRSSERGAIATDFRTHYPVSADFLADVERENQPA